MDDSRGHREPRRLSRKCGHESRVRVTEAHGGVGRQHVQIAAPVLVDEPGSQALGQDDGQSVVVMRRVALLESDHVAHFLRLPGPGANSLASSVAMRAASA